MSKKKDKEKNAEAVEEVTEEAAAPEEAEDTPPADEKDEQIKALTEELEALKNG